MKKLIFPLISKVGDSINSLSIYSNSASQNSTLLLLLAHLWF